MISLHGNSSFTKLNLDQGLGRKAKLLQLDERFKYFLNLLG